VYVSDQKDGLTIPLKVLDESVDAADGRLRAFAEEL
jgi:hypothetical protein